MGTRKLLSECYFPTPRARLRYHRSLKPLPEVGCSAGSSPDAIRPNSRFASVRAISGVQGEPRLPMVSLRSGSPPFRALRMWSGAADPRPDAEASHLLIPQDHFAAVLWGQGIDRPPIRAADRRRTPVIRIPPLWVLVRGV